MDDKRNKGGELLEIYALQIKMSLDRGDTLRMRELYEKTRDLSAAVKDPRSQSVIRECWGRMFGEEGQWQRSYAEFYSAFTHYQEIGNRDKAKQCLKYVVVANMLSGGEQNPFDAREAKVYQNEADVAAIGQLRQAYEKCDVDAFTNALDEIQRAGDTFISEGTRTLSRGASLRKGSSRCHCSLVALLTSLLLSLRSSSVCRHSLGQHDP